MAGALVPTKASSAAVEKLAERGAGLIAQANDLAEVIDYRAQASAVQVLVRQRDLGTAAERAATGLRLRAERRIGQLLAEGQANGTVATKGKTKQPGRMSSATTFDDLGLSRDEASQFKQLAGVPDEDFDGALTDLPVVSRRAIVNLAKANEPTPLRHPAKFSDELMPVLAAALAGYTKVLDPFAGTGRIHEVADALGIESVGIELEPEWAELHPRTQVGNALHLPFRAKTFDAVATSPAYGNRFADHHDARDGSERRSYTHDLGRPLHADNAGQLHWGDEYRSLHERAWREADRVLKPGGRFVLNISDHVRDGQRMPVTAFHFNVLVGQLGLRFNDLVPVSTTRLRYGENAEARPLVEYVALFDKGER